MAVSWLKTGSESANLQQREQQAQAARQAQMGKMFRFFLGKKEEAKITFIDGELSDEGFLIPPRFYEHTVEVAGKWQNFVCPEQTNPSGGDTCPICKSGDRPALISLFTVIDHRGYTSRDGVQVPFSRKLLAAKPGTMEILAKQAVKRGGLIGCTFEVSRVGAQAPAIGDIWDFVEKGDPEELVKKFMVKSKNEKGEVVTNTLFSAADYEKEIPFLTGAELLALGLGGSGGGAKASYQPGGAATGGSSYASHL